MSVPEISNTLPRSRMLGLFTAALVLGACGSGEIAGGDAGPSQSDASTDLCQFAPAESLWVLEGQELSFSISCQTGADPADLALVDLPEGAVFDAADRTVTWTPGLDQAAVYTLGLRSSSLQAASELLIGVADAHGAPNNVPIQDLSAYTMELGLPVIVLEGEPASSSSYEPMTILYRGATHEAEAKLRGKSSLSYPKKSYALRFDKFSSFSETQFADFGNRTRVILTSTFDDNAYFRQRMAYDLWAQLQPSIAVEAYSAVVYWGTEYRGLYTVSDHINDALLQRSALSKDGNLYKAETHDANFLRTANDGSPKDNLHQGYSKTEGDPVDGEPGAFEDLDELVRFVADSDDATFNAGIAELIEVDEYVAWWLHATFILAHDSAGKNSYHYHDQARTWRVVPWDFNDSLGQSWETRRTASDELVTYHNRNEIFRRLSLHPTIGPAIQERYQEALESGPFALDTLDATIDAYEAELSLSAARDWERWQDEYIAFDRWSGRDDFTSPVEEIEYVRDWVADRWQYAHDTYTP